MGGSPGASVSFLVALLVAFMVAVTGCKDEEAASVRVVRSFVDDVRNQRYQRAYRRTAPSYRSRVPFERFRQHVAASVYLQEATGFRAEVVGKPDGGRMRIEGVLLSGGEVPCVAVVEMVDGTPHLLSLAAPAEPLMP